LLAFLPTYFSLLFPGSQYFLVIRVLRLLRIFRVLKLVQYVGEAKSLRQALKASKRKIIVFVFTVLIVVVIFGSLMYVIEGEENGFTSIPRSIYWAIVSHQFFQLILLKLAEVPSRQYHQFENHIRKLFPHRIQRL